MAAAFLRLKEYRILERGYRYRTKEIDIIAWDGRQVVFVEVKFRRSARWGTPAEAVGIRKRKQILFAARGYLREHSLYDVGCRFDVVEVFLDDGGLELRLNHIPGAFGES
jgi:putative endonuclease